MNRELRYSARLRWTRVSGQIDEVGQVYIMGGGAASDGSAAGAPGQGGGGCPKCSLIERREDHLLDEGVWGVRLAYQLCCSWHMRPDRLLESRRE